MIRKHNLFFNSKNTIITSIELDFIRVMFLLINNTPCKYISDIYVLLNKKHNTSNLLSDITYNTRFNFIDIMGILNNYNNTIHTVFILKEGWYCLTLKIYSFKDYSIKNIEIINYLIIFFNYIKKYNPNHVLVSNSNNDCIINVKIRPILNIKNSFWYFLYRYNNLDNNIDDLSIMIKKDIYKIFWSIINIIPSKKNNIIETSTYSCKNKYNLLKLNIVWLRKRYILLPLILYKQKKANIIKYDSLIYNLLKLPDSLIYLSCSYL